MNKWKYNSDQTCYCDGTGTYDRGWYAVGRAGYECGTEPERGPFRQRGQAAKAAAEINAYNYQIIVGETGNECGHVHTSAYASDAAAVREAKRLCEAYRGDGWWRVECEGATVARGGRDNDKAESSARSEV